MVDRQEMDRADDRIGAHRVDDVLGVGPVARVVVDLRTDRVAHAPAQAFRHDGGVLHVDAGRLGGAVQVAGVRELEGAPDQVDRGRIFEGEVVDVIGDHHEAGSAPPASVVEPQEQHARRVRDRPLLGKGLVLALGMTVGVGNRLQTRVAVAFQVVHVRPPSRKWARTAPEAGGRGRNLVGSDGRSAREPQEKAWLHTYVPGGSQSRPGAGGFCQASRTGCLGRFVNEGSAPSWKPGSLAPFSGRGPLQPSWTPPSHDRVFGASGEFPAMRRTKKSRLAAGGLGVLYLAQSLGLRTSNHRV